MEYLPSVGCVTTQDAQLAALFRSVCPATSRVRVVAVASRRHAGGFPVLAEESSRLGDMPAIWARRALFDAGFELVACGLGSKARQASASSTS
jgi:hypothetical protein